MNTKKFEIIKFKNNKLELDINVSPNENTVWLSLDQISLLFEKDKSVISRHIKNIFNEGELDRISVVATYATTALDGKTYQVTYYNLDIIISVGYRIKSVIGTKFRIWANNTLKEYLIKGYVINANRSLITNENYINLVNHVESIGNNQLEMNKRLSFVEERIKSKELPTEKIFYNGDFYDAYSFIQDIINKAINEIIIVDNYVDKAVLDRLITKKKDVQVIIYYDERKSKLLDLDVIAFNKQYGGIVVKNTSKVHDRYIIIDKTIIYHSGASLKDAGKKIFSMSESDPMIINDLINSL